jgi:hypothetical protein
MVTATELARELKISQSRLTELLHQVYEPAQRPGRGKRWGWTPEEAEELKNRLLTMIPAHWIIEPPRILTDAEIDDLAKEFQDGGPVRCPEGVDVDQVLDQLRTRHSGLQEVHVAEETKADGIILMA